MRAFVVVADHGSFKLAARELSRTQPAITLAIQQLEDYIGLKLLERTTRRVTPTVEGERFIPIAERLIRDFDTAIFDLNATAERRSGHVSISALPSVATTILPGIVKAFSEQYPGIHVHMTDGNSRQIQHRMLRNEVDFGIASRWRPSQDLNYRPLLEDRLELICNSDHALAQESGPIEWEELQNYKFLGSGLNELFPSKDALEDPQYAFSTTTTLFAMVKANIGITVLPTLAAYGDEPQLFARPLQGPVVKRKIYLITRKEWTMSPASEAMIEVLLEQIPLIITSLDLEHVCTKIRNTDFQDLG